MQPCNLLEDTAPGPENEKKPKPVIQRCDQCQLDFVTDFAYTGHITGQVHKRRQLEKEARAMLLEKGLLTQGQINNNEFECTVCQLSSNSCTQFKAHLEGAKHKIKLAASQHPGESVPKPVKVTPLVPKSPRFCGKCNLTLNSDTQLKQHLDSKKHKEGGAKPKYHPYARRPAEYSAPDNSRKIIREHQPVDQQSWKSGVKEQRPVSHKSWMPGVKEQRPVSQQSWMPRVKEQRPVSQLGWTPSERQPVETPTPEPSLAQQGFYMMPYNYGSQSSYGPPPQRNGYFSGWNPQ